MATAKGKAAKAAKATSALGLLRKAGFDAISTKKTKLWDIDNADVVIEDIKEHDFSLYMGVQNESFFVVLREGDESTDPIPFIHGTVNPADVDLDDSDLTDKKTAYDFSDIEGFLSQVGADTIQVIKVTALRDETFYDKEGEIIAEFAEGDEVFRAQLS